VEAVDEGEEGCEAAGAGGDVEVGFHVGFEAGEGGGDGWLGKKRRSVHDVASHEARYRAYVSSGCRFQRFCDECFDLT
jgi:hypothetical protein